MVRAIQFRHWIKLNRALILMKAGELILAHQVCPKVQLVTIIITYKIQFFVLWIDFLNLSSQRRRRVLVMIKLLFRGIPHLFLVLVRRFFMVLERLLFVDFLMQLSCILHFLLFCFTCLLLGWFSWFMKWVVHTIKISLPPMHSIFITLNISSSLWLFNCGHLLRLTILFIEFVIVHARIHFYFKYC